MSMAKYQSYEASCGEALKVLDQGHNGHVQMTFPVEWFAEELPNENREGNALDQEVQKVLDSSFRVPKTVENFVKAKEKAPELQMPQMPTKESALIFSDSHGICRAIFDAAPDGRFGTKKFIDNPYNLTQEDIKELIGPKGWGYIVFGCGFDMPASNAVADVIEQNTRLSKLFFFLCKAIQRNDKSTKNLVVLSRSTFEEDPSVHKQVGLGITTAGSLYGFANTARQEFEETNIQYIETDFSPKKPEKLYARVASEILRVGSFGHGSVRVLEKGRFVLRQVSSKPYEAANQEFPLPSEGIIAITGGNGALALVMGEWLLAKAQEQGASGFQIKFLSRSMKISDLNLPTWKRLQTKAAKLGIDVEQAKCDISTQKEVDNLFKEYSPNIVGIIHSAGVLRDSMLMNMTWEQCEDVFESKHRPALYLHGALERFQNPKLRFFWLFSSVAVYGNMGQWNYSGSNSFLDAIARHRRARNKPCTAIQWGAWGDVGMAATMDQSMRNRVANGPFPYFSNAEGLAGLEAGLKTGLPYFTVNKVNPMMMVAMVQPADTVGMCYLRNFHSEVVPTDVAPNLDRNHHYTILRTVNSPYLTNPNKAKLVYDRFVTPKVKEYEKEWGEDFRQWTSTPMLTA